MNRFIVQVGLVQSIFESIQELFILGHFEYRMIDLTVEKLKVSFRFTF